MLSTYKNGARHALQKLSDARSGPKVIQSFGAGYTNLGWLRAGVDDITD